MSLLVICVLMNGKYAVANREQMEAIKIGGMAQGSPGKKPKIKVDASEVRVMATFILAAIHRTQICTGIMSGRK